MYRSSDASNLPITNAITINVLISRKDIFEHNLPFGLHFSSLLCVRQFGNLGFGLLRKVELKKSWTKYQIWSRPADSNLVFGPAKNWDLVFWECSITFRDTHTSFKRDLVSHVILSYFVITMCRLSPNLKYDREID